jgi:dienelactone hydrolase
MDLQAVFKQRKLTMSAVHRSLAWVAIAFLLAGSRAAAAPAGGAERFNGRVATNLGAILHSTQVSSMLDGYYERLSAPHHLQFKSLDAWQQRREIVRRQTLRDIGLDPLPERLPLDVHYGGALDREDYLLRRVYFQTWPGVYASGWLYLPKTPGKHPAILNLHGHWENGAMHPVMQSCCIGLAKKGYVVLMVDSIHLSPESFYVGASSIGVMTFNNMRAIDLLETLPEVDSARIGCTGASGGGQQTMYLMATDDRIKAAVPVALVSYFRRIMSPAGFPHCICNIAPGILRDTDEPELCATFAPRPVLFLSLTGDWTKAFPQEEFPEIRSIYGLYGQEAAVESAQWESEHDFSKPMRERMYAFFNHYLMGKDDPPAAVEPPFNPESLPTLKTLNQPPAVVPDASIIDWYKSRFSPQRALLPDAAACAAYQQNLKSRLSVILGDLQPQGRVASAPHRAGQNDFESQQMSISSEPGIEFPALLLGAKPSAKTALVILVHPKGGQAILKEYGEVVRSLQTSGAAILLPDIRLTGVLERSWRLDGVLWNRPETGMGVTDLRACLDALHPAASSKTRQVVLVGLRDAGFTAVIAGALEPRISAVIADRLGPTFAEGRQSPLIANVLRVGDLPELVAAIAPRGVMLGGVKPARFGFTSSAYEALHAGPVLELREAPLTGPDLTKSIRQALRLN